MPVAICHHNLSNAASGPFLLCSFAGASTCLATGPGLSVVVFLTAGRLKGAVSHKVSMSRRRIADRTRDNWSEHTTSNQPRGPETAFEEVRRIGPVGKWMLYP
jgi:hypothetical protein